MTLDDDELEILLLALGEAKSRMDDYGSDIGAYLTHRFEQVGKIITQELADRRNGDAR